MKRFSIALLLTASLLAQQTAKPVEAPDKLPVGPAIASPVSQNSVTVEERKLHSLSLDRDVPYRVVLPADYTTTKKHRYPTLYLLHGLTGTYTNWQTNTNLLSYAARYSLLIILVEGADSWYTNAATPPQDRYEDYVLKDLIPDVDKNFRTLPDRNHRAIAGLSMGGYGAMKLALRSPDTFAFAGSFSGAFGITRDQKSQKTYAKYGLDKVFGPLDASGQSDNDIYMLANKANASALPYFYFDCGTEDAFLEQNRDFDRLLNILKIVHEFHELSGNHNWKYWNQQLEVMLQVMAKHMKL
jgi:putative tributyrin esterase